MRVTVVMKDDYPYKVLIGTEEENEKIIEQLHKEFTEYDPYRYPYVRGYEFELEVQY